MSLVAWTPVQLIAVVALSIVVAIVINARRLRSHPNMALLPPLIRAAGDLAVKLEDQLILELPPGDAFRASVYAIGTLRWEIVERDANRIVVRFGPALTRTNSMIEVLVAEEARSQTRITLNGSIEGVRSVQEHQLRAKMDQLQSAIELATHSAPWLTLTRD